jgi:hypothetical protein
MFKIINFNLFTHTWVNHGFLNILNTHNLIILEPRANDIAKEYTIALKGSLLSVSAL